MRFMRPDGKVQNNFGEFILWNTMTESLKFSIIIICWPKRKMVETFKISLKSVVIVSFFSLEFH